MGRSLRQDPEHGWHHVMNRGTARERVFFTQADGDHFLHLLAEGTDRFGVQVHAYCLMTNHFHLLLHCPSGGLSAFMQHLSACYTRRLNDRTGRDGPVFRGRFRSIVVDSDEYLSAVGRYIHRNPLDLGPGIDLTDYRWSSYRHYLHPDQAPGWLHTDSLMAGTTREAFRSFVEVPSDQPVSVPVEWAISVATAELAEEAIPGAFDRTVGTLILAQAPPALRPRIAAWLSFPSVGAQRVALHRARKRRDEDRVVDDIASRALHLLAGVTNCV